MNAICGYIISMTVKKLPHCCYFGSRARTQCQGRMTSQQNLMWIMPDLNILQFLLKISHGLWVENRIFLRQCDPLTSFNTAHNTVIPGSAIASQMGHLFTPFPISYPRVRNKTMKTRKCSSMANNIKQLMIIHRFFPQKNSKSLTKSILMFFLEF